MRLSCLLSDEYFTNLFQVIQQGVDVPEGQNDLRRNQLRELALLNGTLREGDGKNFFFLNKRQNSKSIAKCCA